MGILNIEWRDVKGYEGHYKICDKGLVCSIKGTRSGILLPEIRKGYETVRLCKTVKGKRIRFRTSIHRLLAIAFIPNPLNVPQVNHKDGVKSNNSLSNLEWCDNDYNMAHAVAHGLLRGKQLSRNLTGKPPRTNSAA